MSAPAAPVDQYHKTILPETLGGICDEHRQMQRKKGVQRARHNHICIPCVPRTKSGLCQFKSMQVKLRTLESVLVAGAVRSPKDFRHICPCGAERTAFNNDAFKVEKVLTVR